MADEKAKLLMKDEKATDETAELRAQVALLSTQVQSLVLGQQAGGGITAAQLKEVMSELVKVQAEAQAAALREIAERDQREDLNYPRISAYSYPEGDRQRPRPPFKCRMFWNGFDIDWDTTTAAEIELWNQLEPGDYTFHRLDGRTREKVTVTGERNANGVLSKLEVFFPTKENRDTLPSMLAILRDALGLKTPEQQEIARLQQLVAQMQANAPVAA